MKKSLVFVICGLVILTLVCGCGGKPPDDAVGPDPDTPGDNGNGGDDPAPVPGQYSTVTAGIDEPVAVIELYVGDSFTKTAAVINKQGQFTIAPERYCAISKFIDNKAFAIALDSSWQSEYHVIDKNGNVLTKITGVFSGNHMDNAGYLMDYYSEGITAFRQNGLYGFVNVDGEVIAPAQYDEVQPFSDGLAAVNKGVAWEYIDTEGDVVFSLGDYSGCGSFSEGLAYYSDQDGHGYRDKTGAIVFGARYNVSSPREGFFSRYGYFSEGLVPAEVEWWVGDSQCLALGIMDKEGRILFRQDVSDPLKRWRVVGHHINGNKFVNGLLPVCTSDAFSWTGYGFIDNTGNLAIPLQSEWQPVGYCHGYETCAENLDEYCAFYEDLCAVQSFNDSASKIGFIDKTGHVEIDYQYDAVRQFAGGLAAVAVENTNGQLEWSYIDKSGNIEIGGLKGPNQEKLTICNAFNFE